MHYAKTAKVGILVVVSAGALAWSGCCKEDSAKDEGKPASSATTAAATATATTPSNATRPRVKAGTDKLWDPTALQTAFFADKEAWKGKLVRVKGQINSTQDVSKNTPPKYFISLRDPGSTGYQVYCEFDISPEKPAPAVKNNEVVTVQCKIDSDFFKAVKMVGCELE